MKDFAQLTRVAIVFGTVFALLVACHRGGPFWGLGGLGRFGDSHGCPQVLLADTLSASLWPFLCS